MTRGPRTDQRSAEERALIVHLTRLALVRAAPDELDVLDEAAEEYFDDPTAALRTDGRDTPLGSGIDVGLLIPYVLAAVSAVLPVLGTIAAEIGKDVAKDLVKDPVVDGVRRLVKRRPDEPPGPVALSSEQAEHVRRSVVATCATIGLPPETANVIGNATVGALHRR